MAWMRMARVRKTGAPPGVPRCLGPADYGIAQDGKTKSILL